MDENLKRSYGIIIGNNYPSDLKGEDIKVCNIPPDPAKKRACVQLFERELERREAVISKKLAGIKTVLENVQKKEQLEENINEIYNNASLYIDVDLPKIDTVPTIEEKITAIEIAFNVSKKHYQTAQAAVEEYENHWIGKNNIISSFDTHVDPQYSHGSNRYHPTLRTERRKLMWHAIKKGEEFPADLTESDIQTSCRVSPSHNTECVQSITNEITLRKKQKEKAQETKETKENMQQAYDSLKSAGVELERVNLQAQLNKLKEDINYAYNARDEIFTDSVQQDDTVVEGEMRTDHIEL